MDIASGISRRRREVGDELHHIANGRGCTLEPCSREHGRRVRGARCSVTSCNRSRCPEDALVEIDQRAVFPVGVGPGQQTVEPVAASLAQEVRGDVDPVVAVRLNPVAYLQRLASQVDTDSRRLPVGGHCGARDRRKRVRWGQCDDGARDRRIIATLPCGPLARERCCHSGVCVRIVSRNADVPDFRSRWVTRRALCKRQLRLDLDRDNARNAKRSAAGIERDRDGSRRRSSSRRNDDGQRHPVRVLRRRSPPS